MWSAVAVLVLTIAAFFFANQLFDILTYPARNVQLVFLEVTAMLSIYMKVCLTAGIIGAMPFLIYQFIMFIAPGLTTNEKRYVFISIPWIFVMFLTGVTFGYFLFLPNAITFLTTFANDIATPTIRIDAYVSFITRMLLVLGLIFELPVIMTLLGRIGVVSSKWLIEKWKIAIILSFVLSAVVTPTSDPLNMAIVAAPIIILYLMSIGLVKLVQKPESDEVTTDVNVTNVKKGRAFLRILYKLAGIILMLLGLLIIVISWTAHFSIWPDLGFLAFMQNTWVWSTALTVFGSFIFALGIVFVKV